MAGVLVSFLGISAYQRFKYKFSGRHDETVEANYAATAVAAYMQKNEQVRIDRMVIAGTSRSIWNKLTEYLSDMAAEMFGNTAESRSTALELRSADIVSLNKRISELSADEASLAVLLPQLESYINQALSSVKLEVTLVIHPENFSLYENQIMLIDRFRSLKFLNSDCEIYLDITNGLRIMPFAVFAAFQCLCKINGFKIKRIFYLPEFMPPSETSERLDAIEECKSALRFLKKTQPDRYRQSLEEIKSYLSEIKSSDTLQRRENSVKESSVCLLDVAETILSNSSMIDKFQVSADPAVFAGAVDCPEFKVRMENSKNLRDISFHLGMGQYQYASELISNYGRDIERSIGNSDISGLLHRFFSWAKPFNNTGTNKQKAVHLKSLASFYLYCQNYVQAINAAYSAVYNYEIPISNFQNEQQQKSRIKKIYSNSDKFIDYRAMLVHLQDKSVALKSPGSRIAMAFEEKEGKIDSGLFQDMVSESIESMGVKKIRNENKSRHVLITFIGSGDYGRCDYKYINPFHLENDSLEISGSRMVGITLARKLKNSLDEDLSLLVVCGTYSSNWSIVMQSFEAEFTDKIPPEYMAEFSKLRNLVAERQKDKSPLTKNDSMDLAAFFDKAGSFLGFEFKLIFISPEISKKSVQLSLQNSLGTLLRQNDELSFDITHSYRIIPILVLCFSQYYGSLLNTKIRHIFYGDIQPERDFNFLNVLKSSQLEDDAVFNDIMSRIRNSVLSGIDGKLPLTGTVYEMKNISNLMRYFSAINQFKTTGNLMFLKAMMKIELRKRRPDLFYSFINGAFMKNYMLISKSCTYLKPVLDELKQQIKDPVMSFLRGDILDNLSSLPYDSEDKTSGITSKLRFYIYQADMHLKYENIHMSLLYCYQCMLYVGDILWREGRSSLQSKGITAGDDGKLIFRGRHNRAVICLFNIALNNRSAGDIVSHFNDSDKNSGCAFYAAACFSRKIWQNIRNARNSIFHFNTSEYTDSAKVKNAVQTAVNTIINFSRILEEERPD
jgi:hypothetical protein